MIRSLRAILSVGVLLASARCSEVGHRPSRTPEQPPGPCLERLRIQPLHNDPFELLWLYPRGGTFGELTKELVAERIDRAAFRPLRSGALGDRALLWLSRDQQRIVVDEELFSTLALVDVTWITEPRRSKVGRYRPEHLPDASPRAIAAILMRANVIRTWAHNFSELCLRDETREGARTHLRYDGIHTYNGIVHQDFAFEVEVDEETREVTTTRGLGR
jgi:hypothetical protein